MQLKDINKWLLSHCVATVGHRMYQTGNGEASHTLEGAAVCRPPLLMPAITSYTFKGFGVGTWLISVKFHILEFLRS